MSEFLKGQYMYYLIFSYLKDAIKNYRFNVSQNEFNLLSICAIKKTMRIKLKCLFKCKSSKQEERQHFVWCPVYFYKLKLNVMYLHSLLEFFFSLGDNYLVTPRKNQYLWEIAINILVLDKG